MSVRLRHLSAVAAVALGIAPVAVAAGGDLRSPDTRDRAAALVSSPQDLRSPDVRDRAGAAETASVIRGDQPGRDIALIRGLPAPQPVTVSTEAFDWADALTGAAGMLGVLAIVLGIAALGGRSRRAQPLL